LSDVATINPDAELMPNPIGERPDSKRSLRPWRTQPGLVGYSLLVSTQFALRRMATAIPVIVVIFLVCIGFTSAPARSQIPGGMPAGDPESLTGFIAALMAADVSFALPIRSQDGGAFEIINTLLDRRIPAPGDCNLGARGDILRLAIIDELRRYDRAAAPYQRIFGVTRAAAFIGEKERVVLAICDFCGTAVLARRGEPVNGDRYVQSPQIRLNEIVTAPKEGTNGTCSK
jgi:hypothetical protein